MVDLCSTQLGSDADVGHLSEHLVGLWLKLHISRLGTVFHSSFSFLFWRRGLA